MGRRPWAAALLAGGLAVAGCAGAPPPIPPAASPLDATYDIGGERVTLAGGVAERPAAPGSASKVSTRLWGAPIEGDLTGDGDDDAVVWLVHQTGGSGTFHYLAAAYRAADGYRGTRAVLLGDRIAPDGLAISRRLVSAAFLDHGPGQPMADPPAVPAEAHLKPAPEGLEMIGGKDRPPTLVDGWLVMGHEARSFTPCAASDASWVLGDVDVIAEMTRRHREATPGAVPYAPVFVTLDGEPATKPAEGFGADYAGAIAVRELVQVWPAGNCNSDRAVVETPLPGTPVTSPIEVRGRARGAWFFEGEVGLRLVGADGTVIARGFATAQAEWMVKGFAPFAGTLAFEGAAPGTRATLVVRRNNPSDNRDLDEALEIPVVLK